MVDQDRLRELRALGVKAATFSNDAVGLLLSVEFFEQSHGFENERSEHDTIVPAAPGEDELPPNVPPALARLLRNGSVS